MQIRFYPFTLVKIRMMQNISDSMVSEGKLNRSDWHHSLPLSEAKRGYEIFDYKVHSVWRIYMLTVQEVEGYFKQQLGETLDPQKVWSTFK